METLGTKLEEARIRKGFSVVQMAEKLGVSRRAYSYYEEDRSVPKPRNLKIICESLEIRIEDLYDTAPKKEQFVPDKITGQDIRNQKAFGDNEDDGLLYVPIHAQAGYAIHHMDPVFLRDLQRINIPGNKFRGDKFRYFEVEGDSMYPTLSEGMQVIAQKIDHEYWKQLQDYYIHIVVTTSQIMIKRLVKLDDNTVAVISDNEDMYEQFILPYREVAELWLVKRKVDWEMTPPKRFELKVGKK